ncbi:hypothetical protein NCU03644 [Neurospora crassa OR74A]|uniref:Uncharacterized protein n=1 Tax=Neurospora crassa (strain ATCC 24698 / 74-OR23-1A / CBS 708.71 / DSM 1257 / FGSC 987) TaxID=367110 RepID=Q1K7P5_NEUCR|nr:hypothetical protein NCU03644 [Neurospora crassa OR74A]EAA32135.3 hypothetical protein NCU03644 [Neurospora crassa OR74A]|eukprot:XP_961371.3 hypothetical protein NCU03644 [Neurospora crassa OR74A]
MLPDGDALLWRSSLVLASGRSDDSSAHFPTHTRHPQASLIQEQVGTGAVVIVDVGTVPATEPSQRQRAAGEQPAGAEDNSQESTQDSTRPSDRVQIEMSGPNRVKRIVPEG